MTTNVLYQLIRSEILLQEKRKRLKRELAAVELKLRAIRKERRGL